MTGIVAFLEVAKHLNFARAAANLKITPSTLSRNIKYLESCTSTMLFYRTTRTVTLTEAGRIFYDYCMRGVAEIEKAEEILSCLNSSPSGLINISSPVCFGQLHVAPYVKEFMSNHPNITIELTLSSKSVNQVETGMDIVFKIGTLNDSNLVARKLATNTQVLVATPDYIRRHGTVNSPDELEKHNCLSTDCQTPQSNWNLTKNGDAVSVKVCGNFRANSSLLVHEYVLSGDGIALLPMYIVQPNIMEGKLIQLLPEWRSESSAIYAMYVHSKFVAPKIKALTNYFVGKFSPSPPWEFSP